MSLRKELELLLTGGVQLVEAVPKTVNDASLTLSDRPANGKTRPLEELLGLTVGDLGLKYERYPAVKIVGGS